MQDDRDDYEPIIATRPHRQPLREETQPLWRLVLALSGGLAVVLLLAWWLMGRPSSDSASTVVQTESSPPEIRVEQEPTPPAVDSDANAGIAAAPAPPANNSEANATAPQPASPASSAEPAASTEQGAVPERAPEVAADNAMQPPPLPATISMLLTSPDSQVRFEVRGPLDSSPPLTSKAGEVVDLVPGTYRVVASGAQLETIEREITLVGGGPAEYTVELCAQPEQEHEDLAGRVVEQRACTNTPECESMFTILSEHAEQLVKDRAFRTQQCAKWRDTAAPDGRWTLDTKCDGEAVATTCRIEISAGACTATGPRRSVRGEACPRAELH
jgi:hypothetical protein